MASVFDLSAAQNVKAPVQSCFIPHFLSWSVEYQENDKWKKKYFLNVTEAYGFYKQLVEILKTKTSNNQR